MCDSATKSVVCRLVPVVNCWLPVSGKYRYEIYIIEWTFSIFTYKLIQIISYSLDIGINVGRGNDWEWDILLIGDIFTNWVIFERT